jgi:hypothetical protein
LPEVLARSSKEETEEDDRHVTLATPFFSSGRRPATSTAAGSVSGAKAARLDRRQLAAESDQLQRKRSRLRAWSSRNPSLFGIGETGTGLRLIYGPKPRSAFEFEYRASTEEDDT